MKKGLLFSVLALAAMAQAVEFDGQVRYRLENGNSAFDNNVDAKIRENLRAQVGLKAKPQDGVTVYVQAQTNRVLGSTDDEDALDLHQAYVNWNCLLLPKLGVTAGRFELAKADQRFFGIDEWQDMPTAHDGFMLSYGTPFTKIDIYSISKVRKVEVEVEDQIKEYNQDVADVGLYFNNILDKNVDLFFNFSELGEVGEYESDVFDLKNSFSTIGLHYDNTYFDKLGVNVNFATQYGKYEVTTLEISEGVGTFDTYGFDYTGMMYGLDASWELGLGLLNKVGFGYESTSADDPDTGDFGWQELYGAKHKFHGYQDIARPDYFINGYYGTNQGLEDRQFNFQGVLPAGFSYKLDYHLFRFMKENHFTDDDGNERNVNTDFGNEIDFSMAMQVDNISVNVGYSLFTPTDNIARDGDPQSWMYFQVTAGF